MAVSTLDGCNHRYPDGSCISSVEGTITSGTQSPELGSGDNRIKVHTVTGGQTQAVFNSAPQAFETGRTGASVVQFLPARPNGQRIGNRTFATGSVTVVGAGSATITGAGSVQAGASAVYTATDLRDAAGVPIPDGAIVAVSTLGGCNHRAPDNSCIGSAESAITNGAQSPEFGVGDNRIKLFTVTNGSITFTFQAPAGGTSVLQLLPARASGSRIGNRAFAVKSVSVTP